MVSSFLIKLYLEYSRNTRDRHRVSEVLTYLEACVEAINLLDTKSFKGEISNINEFTTLAADGIENVVAVLKELESGKLNHLDFVELNACPGGCVGGGGQPFRDGEEKAAERAKKLYGLDKINDLRFSHENPAIQKIYEDYFEKPLSHKSHELLHTDHEGWNMPK